MFSLVTFAKNVENSMEKEHWTACKKQLPEQVAVKKIRGAKRSAKSTTVFIQVHHYEYFVIVENDAQVCMFCSFLLLLT